MFLQVIIILCIIKINYIHDINVTFLLPKKPTCKTWPAGWIAHYISPIGEGNTGSHENIMTNSDRCHHNTCCCLIIRERVGICSAQHRRVHDKFGTNCASTAYNYSPSKNVSSCFLCDKRSIETIVSTADICHHVIKYEVVPSARCVFRWWEEGIKTCWWRCGPLNLKLNTIALFHIISIYCKM